MTRGRASQALGVFAKCRPPLVKQERSGTPVGYLVAKGRKARQVGKLLSR